jgi:hypothetical protein
MTKYVRVVLISLLTFKIVPSLAAIQATFSLVAKTPTSIGVPANRQTIVQYLVTNNTAITRTLTMVPIPNVTQLTSDSSQCRNPFTLAKNQSCNLTLLINGAQQTSSYFGGPVVCKTKNNSNTPDPFLCSQPEASMELYIYPTPPVTPTAHKLYVSNWDGGSISLCYINDDGTIAHCLVSAVSDTFLNPEALAIHGGYLFVANIGGGMSACLIDSITGELSDCQNATNNVNAAEIHAPDGIAINGSTAYISSSGPESAKQGMSACDVSNGSLTNCSFTQGNQANYSIPSDIALYNNYLYITNFNSQNVPTSYCSSISPYCNNSNGSVDGTSDLLNEPEGIAFATINANNYAYFTNHGNHTVTLCQAPIDAPPTTFIGCTTTEGYFTGFGNLAILPNPLKAFIPSGLKTIAMCDVSETDGSLSNCINSTEIGFNNPSGLVIE